VLLLIYITVFAGCRLADTGPEKAVETFLRALATRDYKTAKSLAAGKVLYTLTQHERNGTEVQPARMVELSLRTQAATDKYLYSPRCTKRGFCI